MTRIVTCVVSVLRGVIRRLRPRRRLRFERCRRELRGVITIRSNAVSKTKSSRVLRDTVWLLSSDIVIVVYLQQRDDKPRIDYIHNNQSYDIRTTLRNNRQSHNSIWFAISSCLLISFDHLFCLMRWYYFDKIISDSLDLYLSLSPWSKIFDWNFQCLMLLYSRILWTGSRLSAQITAALESY